jgi:hypothetical protein
MLPTDKPGSEPLLTTNGGSGPKERNRGNKVKRCTKRAMIKTAALLLVLLGLINERRMVVATFQVWLSFALHY